MYKAFNQPAASVNDVMDGAQLTGTPQNVPFAAHLQVPAGTYTTGAPFVTRAPRQRLRYLYSYGKQTRDWFRMIMTGGVESTKFQKQNGVMFDATFNDGLFEAGYPQNTGISVKVVTIPDSLAQGNGPRMRPQPQQTNSIFTRRAYNTAPSLNAKPAGS